MSNEYLMKIPDNLKRLVRYVLKSFYNFELYLIMDVLMHYPCIKEEDIAEILKIDHKHIRQYLHNLKQEKFISEKSLMETTNDGKQMMQKKSYFYINYKMMVNVVKYKLDKIRIQIETEEKQCTSRASFKCTQCKRAYSDLDTREIFLTMRCIYCNGEVEEDSSNQTNRATRNLLLKFNTQMELIFILLRDVEHIRLASDLLSPKPTDYSYVYKSDVNYQYTHGLNSSGQPAYGKGKVPVGFDGSIGSIKTWSGDATRHKDALSETRIRINLNETTNQHEDVFATQAHTATNDLEAVLIDATEDTSSNNTLSSIIKTKTTLNTQLSSSTSTKQLQQQQTTSTASGGTGTSSSSSSSVSLDEVILKTLFIYEKKLQSSESATSTSTVQQQSQQQTPSAILTKSPPQQENVNTTTNTKISNSSITIQSHLKKRDFNHIISSDYHANDMTDMKKRRLNGYKDLENSDYLSKEARNGRLYEHMDTYENETTLLANNNLINKTVTLSHLNSGGGSVGGSYTSTSQDLDELEEIADEMDLVDHDSENEYFVIKVQNEYHAIDCITAEQIAKMNKQEKEIYIDKCRQLYTAMYEL